MIAELESRAALYSALALGFAYPEANGEFDAIAGRMELAASGLHSAGNLQSAIRNLQSAIRNPAPLRSGGYHRQSATLSPAEEHTFLFHRQAHCPPYESSYCPVAMAQSLADIAGFYRAFGVQVAPQAHERADHIGSQLEFVAVLCAKEARALQNDLAEQAEICRDARRAFLADHLGRWAPAFAARVKDKARLPLYPALTEALMALLTREAEELGLTLSPAQEAVSAEPAEMEGELCE